MDRQRASQRRSNNGPFSHETSLLPGLECHRFLVPGFAAGSSDDPLRDNMPLQKYSLTPAPSAWDALLDYSAEARQVYAHLVLGKLAERAGLVCCRRKGIERDLGLRGSTLDAALADLQQAGVAAVSDIGNGSLVVALLHYADIAPTRPNNRRGWLLDIQKVPDCEAKDSWVSRWPYDLQLPVTTGGRPSLVNHKSNTSDSPEQKRTEQKRTEQKAHSRFAPPTEDEVCEHMLDKLGDVEASTQAEEFVLFYESKGWMVGKSKMKSWKAAASRWANRNQRDGASKAAKKPMSIDETMRLMRIQYGD